MPRTYTRPSIPKVTAKAGIARAVELLERYRHCANRANEADASAIVHWGSYTAHRYSRTAANWEARAEAAWQEAMALLRSDNAS